MSNLVVKDNRLIEASYSLGVVEQRLMLLAIVGARETGEGITPETLLTVRAEDYAKHFNVERHTAYEVLQEAVETLFNRRATVDVYDRRRDKMRPMVVRWVTAMQYEEQQACVTLRFGIEVVPLITRLEENFTSYELQQIAGLKSAYAIRLYELLMQWKAAAKTPVFELQQFRKQLGLINGKYKTMINFKTRVLDLAVGQINEHTDITVSYEQHKKGRTITGFSFAFKQKKSEKPAKEKQVKEPRNQCLTWGTSENHLFKELSKKCTGLTKEYVEQLAQKQRKDLSFVLNDMFMRHAKSDSFELELTD